jgi:hypothetical protein
MLSAQGEATLWREPFIENSKAKAVKEPLVRKRPAAGAKVNNHL